MSSLHNPEGRVRGFGCFFFIANHSFIKYSLSKPPPKQNSSSQSASDSEDRENVLK